MTELRTFQVPEAITGTPSHLALAQQMIHAWRTDGIFQIAMTQSQVHKAAEALAVSRQFFALPLSTKSRHVSDLTYAGYIASGEELTAGEADYSEIFTVCKDLPLDDSRVQAAWPCHGPVPWPNQAYRHGMKMFTEELGSIGDRLLELVSLGLGLADLRALSKWAEDGWHHMRVLRFPAASPTTTRGIGAHTDYGMLVIAAQDDVGGLYVRPPVEGETRKRNWLPGESSAGMYEHEEPWTFVRPVPDVLTVFPGDILQFITNGYLLSTPHKVRLNTRERYSVAYFHEPNFEACVRPLLGPRSDDYIHYGTHFTNMFTRCYPERVTTRRIVEEDRLANLPFLRRVRGAA
jgi:2-oxoglutarate dioxygenase / 2-oxoglutarate/L-arginine monooxygenase/decarboxylase